MLSQTSSRVRPKGYMIWPYKSMTIMPNHLKHYFVVIKNLVSRVPFNWSIKQHNTLSSWFVWFHILDCHLRIQSNNLIHQTNVRLFLHIQRRTNSHVKHHCMNIIVYTLVCCPKNSDTFPQFFQLLQFNLSFA